MKYFLLFIYFISFFTFAQESKIDSLKTVLKSANSEETKLSTLECLNKILIGKSSLEKSLPYFFEMASTANNLGNDKLESRAYTYISEANKNKMDSIKAIEFAKKALLIDDKNNFLKGYLIDINQLGRVYHHFQYDKKAIKTYKKGINEFYKNEQEKCLFILAQIYSNLSISYDKLGKTNKSIEVLLKAVEIAEKTNSANQKSYGLYTLGYKYMDLENYKKAEKYFLKSLKFSDSVSLQIYANMNHHALGVNYSRWGKYKKAVKQDNIALKYFRKQGNKLYEFDVLNNIAVLYGRMDIPDSTVKYGELALQIAKEMKHKLAISGANITLSNAYLNLKQYTKAESILIRVAKDTVNSNIIDENGKEAIYSDFSEIYEGQKRYKKSLEFYKKLKILSDSINKKKLDSKFSNIETKYQTEKKEKENLQLKADKATQELQLIKEAKQKQYFAFALLASLLTLGIFGFYYQQNKKQKAIIENLQKDLHHRVKNNLAIIDSLVEDIKDEFNNEKFILKLTDLQNRIDSINEVHQQLYQNTDITNLKFKKYVEKLANNVQHSFAKENIKINNNINDSFTLDVEKSFPIGLIINEFLTNSFKYAFTDKEKGIVNVDLKEKGVNYLLSLSDNGKGLPDDFDISKQDSFGVDVMQLLSKQLKGTFTLDGTNGVNLQIEFPKV